ncbi:gamma-glutamylcyclotransferase [Leucobacter luti]|uniref:Uncharacterized protein n=1 Tax=Leucobacter luti TaxID=340320 RepID=A0A4Q7U7W8_9MICO|nr:gamma-glutamylcyclotransferase [Leucobacter luti]MBL3700892.1 gamma-glutamylcyclotransferase [Leucobacter luti]RZT68890.1 hypothetical protein EV139_0622 [Leucobacter luti]
MGEHSDGARPETDAAGSAAADGPEFAADQAPRVRPLSYPGVHPAGSVVITQDRVWPIRDRWSEPLDWERSAAQRLGTTRVQLDAPSAERLGLSTTTLPHLNSVLEEGLGVVADGLVPVLAIGSNASPAQLRHKFGTEPGVLMVPSLRARVTGLRVGFAGFVASLGYVPATIFPEPGAQIELAVQFLSRSQLRAVDRTETPWYRRVWIADAEIQLQTGETLRGAYAYVALGGYLGDADGGFVMGATTGEPEPSVGRRFGTQSALLLRMLREPGIAAAWGSAAAPLTLAGAAPAASARVLREAGLVLLENPLAELPDQIGRAAQRYGEHFTVVAPELRSVSAEPGHAGDRLHVTVARTHDLLERKGISVVRLGAELQRVLGDPHHVEVVSEALAQEVGPAAPRVVATVYRERADAAPDAAPDTIEIDHMIRMGAGLEVGERAVVRPVEVSRPTGFDALLGIPNYVSFRVTLADPASTEREVCLMSALSLQLLGVTSGDYVVLEGSPGSDGVVPTVVIKAFELPDDVWQERVRVSGGTWGGRFPGARDTLGVHPDIPTIFIDASTRARLGVGEQQLAVVRARPARRQQFGNELREMLLLLAVAFIGIVGLIPDAWIGGALVAALLVGAFALMTLKMRRRLSHRAQRPLRAAVRGRRRGSGGSR